jgi:diaminopimelate epimerase
VKFTKMQGLGNDYVYVDCTKEELATPSDIARAVSDRHFGIGSDGLILIKPSNVADFYMEMYNADKRIFSCEHCHCRSCHIYYILFLIPLDD